VLSTVAAGVVTGSFGTLYGMSTRTRLAVEDFWEYAAFVANTLVFLLVGIELQIGPLVADAGPVLLAFVATLGGRALAVYGSIPLTRLTRSPVPGPWAHVLWWGGLRGSLSMVLVLGLPHTFVGRELLVHLVFGVVSASLFLQGLTVPPLLARLGMGRAASPRARQLDAGRARLVGVDRALEALGDLERQGLVSRPAADRVRRWYDSRRAAVHQDLAAIVAEAGELAAREVADTLLRLADAEREAVRRAWRADVVGEEAMKEVLVDLDERTAALREAAHAERMGDAIDALLTSPGRASNADAAPDPPARDG
jgi:CPA1 family monovalent cation:H+ antiporter